LSAPRIAVLALVLILVGSGVVLPVRAQPSPATGFNVVSATWGSLANPVEVGAGSQDAPLTITAQYFFASTATGIVASLDLPPSFTDLNGGSNPSSYITGTVPTGTVLQFVFYLDVAPSTPVGTYIFPMTIQWGAETAINSISVFQSTNVTVHLNGKVMLNFIPEQSSIVPGAVTNVRIVLSNNGSGPASQISTTITSSQQVSVLTRFPNLAILDANSSTVEGLQVYAPSTSANTPVVLSFTSTYFDAYGALRTVTQSVGLFVGPLPTTSPIDLEANPTCLQAGRVNNFTITLTDNGTSPIQGISAVFSIVGGQATWLSPGIVQAQTLDPGDRLVIQAKVYDAPSTQGSLTLQGILRYSYENITTQETRNLGLLSRGEIDLELTSSVVLPTEATPGQIVSMTLTITNVGVITASAVTAQASMPDGFQAIGSSSSFVGDMQVDSPSTLTISALVMNSTVPGNYTMPVALNYFDNLRTPLSQTVNVNVQVVSASQAGSTTTQTFPPRLRGFFSLLALIAIIIVVIVVASLYLWRRSSSRKAAL
jgi:uncharacterized repeat protein (TIGR01451 family)